MECREVRQLAEAFVSEQLLVETTRAIVAHLEGCPSCRAEIDGLRRLRAATRSAFTGAPELQVRPEFVASLGARLQAEHGGQAVSGISRRRWLALAASTVLVAGGGWEWRVWSKSRLSLLLADAVGDHRFCALTFKLDERPIRLEEAAARYDGVYGALAAVEPSSPALSGGALRIVERHSCVYRGRRFAHLVLMYKEQPVSLLVAADDRSRLTRIGSPEGSSTPASLPVTDGFHVASFRGERHVVLVVSSLPDRDVREVAQAMAGPVSRVLAGA